MYTRVRDVLLIFLQVYYLYDVTPLHHTPLTTPPPHHQFFLCFALNMTPVFMLIINHIAPSATQVINDSDIIEDF